MKFSIKEWRRMYDAVHSLGKSLHESSTTCLSCGQDIEPSVELSKDVKEMIETKIISLKSRTSNYLTQCDMPMTKPLWKYEVNNPETHASAPEFKYGELIA